MKNFCHSKVTERENFDCCEGENWLLAKIIKTDVKSCQFKVTFGKY